MSRETAASRFLLPLLLYAACGSLGPGGSGTETTTGIVGAIVNTLGDPQARVQVRLLPADYNPVMDSSAVSTDTTDALGSYVFNVVDSGDFTVLAVHIDNRTRALVSGIHAAGDTVTAPTCTLRIPGAVKVMLPGGINSSTGYVYVPGSSTFVFLNGQGDSVNMDSVPAGTLPSVEYAETNTSLQQVMRYNVSVVPGETVTIAWPGWKHMRRLFLNTTASGAAVSENVTGFPALVRLTSSNYDFDEAQAGGGDVRFAKNDNTPLAYEIERWDPVADSAEVWVMVDTVYGDDDTRFICMYWGNETAADASDGASVFDTANGFRGVWHMNEMTGDIQDASVNNYDGVRNGNLRSTDGNIGYAQVFDGSGDYCGMGNVLNPGNAGFTVTAWIRRADTDNIQTIIAKSSGGTPSATYGWLVAVDTLGRLEGFMASAAGNWGGAGTFAYASNVAILDTVAWHHIAAVFDRSGSAGCRLYIDGADVTANQTGDITGVGSLVNTVDLRIGSEADGGYQWNGRLDECTVAFASRSPDWVRLSYMNQRTDDRLIQFK